MKKGPTFRQRLYKIIFESNTPSGKLFDVILLWVILASVLIVIIESVQHVKNLSPVFFIAIEWGFTILFTIEYLFRIYSARRRFKYISSFFGIIDLLAILPTYISLVFPGSQYLLVVRSIRLLRVFRVLKLSAYLNGANMISSALVASRHKIAVFLGTVLTIVIIVGTMMYIIEGPENGFLNIPTSIYWAIVTLTTVGFGDLTSITPIGKILASILMITGYGVIAVPTGIVTSEMIKGRGFLRVSHEDCKLCQSDNHDLDANYCKVCGRQL